MLGVLLVVYALNFLDRQIINILAEPIKRDLGLRDWHMGLMTGLGFALFYSTLGLPIARLAERFNRSRIIAVALAAWSGFTILCGFSSSFLQLLAARVGVGAGEAGCTPAAQALIADSVPRERLGAALSIYAMGTSVGSLTGMVLGGLIADAWGWRVAFTVAGAPGLLMALVVWLTVPEPRKPSQAAASAAPIALMPALVTLLSNRAFVLICLGAAACAFVAYGHSTFHGSFFFRNHAAELARAAASFGLEPVGLLGILLGVVLGVSGATGILIGGWLADRVGAQNPAAYLKVGLASQALAAPVYVSAMFAPSLYLSLGLLGLSSLIGGAFIAPVGACVMSVVPPSLRATATAVLFLIMNLLGMGLGPVAVGLLSDHFATSVGDAVGLRWALALSCAFSTVAIVLFGLAARDISETQTQVPSPAPASP